MKKEPPLIEVIHMKCVQCCLGNAEAIIKCPSTGCPLLPYRPLDEKVIKRLVNRMRKMVGSK